MAAKQDTNQPKKRNFKKAILIGLGVAVTAVGGFFGWKAITKKKQEPTDQEDETLAPQTTFTPTKTSSQSQSSYVPTPPVKKDDFPLKKGSKGERVKTLQLALIAKHGKTILPKYGADGDFGSEVQAALTKLNLPIVVDESTFTVLTQIPTEDPATLAKKLYEAATAKSFSSALDSLKKIKSTSEYSAVSDKFKEYRISSGVRKTLVTGMLDTFKSASEQDAIRLEFLRMGLKYDGAKWSIPTLSGNDQGKFLITVEPAELIDLKAKIKVKVPVKTVVGHFIASKNNYTLFKTLEKNKKLIVKSKSVIFYETN
ncbi:MAG: hypothetical protein IT233_12585 [Bacteroidia bacterium]|nr:hypothetical protein [Bacteroidia bacterium]